MSKKIDNRIVEMQFNNKQFESGVKTSLDSLSELKKGLNLENSAKGLSNLGDVAKHFSLAGIAEGVDTISQRFTNLGIIGVTAIQNITNAAINYAKTIVKSLTTDPITLGLDEYETKLNSIQTILANTQSEGTNIDIVTKALNELNTYSDKTIYNFQQMARNIGTFTAAGVNLDTSVAAIKGIANLAAVSGSNADQASTAMYQLSQALATGSVKLMDWNSVVNAGMGGKVFQEALKDTARVHGVAIDDIIKNNGSFRDSLQTGWLSSEILTETLSKFTGDLTAEQLKSMGYTEKQVAEILKLGETANDAATKVKTFHQLLDTLKETAQSGWAQTWEILFGNFDEAKELFTSLNDVIGKFIGDQDQARNDMLQGWKDFGGRTELIKGLGNVFKFLLDIIKPIREAFREIFPPTTAKQLYDLTHSFLEFTEKLKLSDTTTENIKRTFAGLFAVLDIGKQIFSAVAELVWTLIKSLTEGSGGVLAFTGSIGDWLVSLDNALKGLDLFEMGIEIFKKVLGTITGAIKIVLGDIDSLKEGFEKIGDAISVFFRALGGEEDAGAGDEFLEKVGYYAFMIRETLLPAFWELRDRLAGVGEALGEVYDVIKRILSPFIEVVEAIAGAVGKLFESFGKSFEETGPESLFHVINGGLLAGILLGLKKIIGSVLDIAKSASGFMDGLTKVLDGVRGCLKAYQNDIQSKTLLRIAEAIAILVVSLLLLSTIEPAKLESALKTITLLGIELVGAMKVLTGFSLNFLGLTGVAIGMVALAGALLILSVALKIISTLEWDEIVRGMTGLAGVITMLVTASKLMAANTKNMVTSAGTLIAFAVAIGILSVSLRLMASVVEKFGEMDLKTIGKGLLAIGAILAELTIFLKVADFGKMGMANAAGLFILAAALGVIALAMEKMGQMDGKAIAKSLIAIGLVLAELVVFEKLSGGSSGMISTATGILILSGALLLISVTLKEFAKMSAKDIAKSIITLALALGILVVAMKFMEGSIAGAAALVIMAGAMLLIAGALQIFAGMSLAEIGKSLLVLVGVLVIFAGAGLLLGPLTPVLMGVSVALLLFGAAILAAGIGVALLSTGLVALAGIGVAGIAVLKQMILSFAETIPEVMKAIGKGIIEICQTIIDGAPKVIEAVVTIVSGLLDAFATLLPKIEPIIIQLIDMILRILVDAIPKIFEAGWKILMAFLQGISDHIGEVVKVAGDIIVRFLQEFATQVVRITNELFKTIIKIINGLAAAIRGNSSELVAAIKNLITAIIEAFKKLAGMFAEIGKMIIKGILKGFGSMGKEILEGVKSIGNKIKNGFKSLFGIDSPSKVFAEYGTYMGQGLVVGIKAIGGKVSDAANAMGEKAHKAVGKGLSGIKDALKADVDINPTIRPVVDMTDVQNGIDSTFAKSQAIDVTASSKKAATVYTPVKSEISNPKNAPVVQSVNSPPIYIENHYTVRNDQDIRKISQDLKTTLDRHAFAKGVMAT